MFIVYYDLFSGSSLKIDKVNYNFEFLISSNKQKADFVVKNCKTYPIFILQILVIEKFCY